MSGHLCQRKCVFKKKKKILTHWESFVSVPPRIVLFFSTLWKLYSNLTFKAFWEPSLLKKIMSISGSAECLLLCRIAVLYFSLLRNRNTWINSEKLFLWVTVTCSLIIYFFTIINCLVVSYYFPVAGNL